MRENKQSARYKAPKESPSIDTQPSDAIVESEQAQSVVNDIANEEALNAELAKRIDANVDQAAVGETDGNTNDVVVNAAELDNTAQGDAINPDHYRSHPSGVECIDITRDLQFAPGNAIKYAWRAGLKDNDRQDLEKALWYINDVIEKRPERLQLSADGRKAYDAWFAAESPGYRQKFISNTVQGNYKVARSIVEEWLTKLES